MGRLFMWFQCNDAEELKAEKAKLEKKIKELTEEVAAIDERIAKIESEN